MFPKTETEKRIWSLSRRLKPLTNKQEQWMLRQVNLSHPYTTLAKGGTWCGIAEKCNEYQVIRVYLVDMINTRSAYLTVTDTSPHVQIVNDGLKYEFWVSPEGKVYVLGGACHQSSSYCRARYKYICYDISRNDYQFRNDNTLGWYYSSSLKYPIPEAIYVKSLSESMTLRCGNRKNFINMFLENQGYRVTDIVKSLFDSPSFETLVKTGNAVMLSVYGSERQSISFSECPELKIGVRYGYFKTLDRKGLRNWIDMIMAIRGCKGDLHNPSLVCPANLTEMHDKWVAKNTKRIERERLERELEEAKEYEQEYYDRWKSFLDIRLTDEHHYAIIPCPSPQQMVIEGVKMKHCVGRYYRREDSLILFCRRLYGGKRISTIELDVRSWKIVQNRGACNQTPEYYEEVNKLIMDNIKLFKKARPKKARKRKEIQEGNIACGRCMPLAA